MMVDLCGIKEIADAFGVQPNVVVNWAHRRSDFPEPLARLAMGPVFSMQEVLDWRRAAERRKRKERAF